MNSDWKTNRKDLQDRMQKLAEMPPPSLEEVREQWWH